MRGSLLGVISASTCRLNHGIRVLFRNGAADCLLSVMINGCLHFDDLFLRRAVIQVIAYDCSSSRSAILLKFGLTGKNLSLFCIVISRVTQGDTLEVLKARNAADVVRIDDSYLLERL